MATTSTSEQMDVDKPTGKKSVLVNFLTDLPSYDSRNFQMIDKANERISTHSGVRNSRNSSKLPPICIQTKQSAEPVKIITEKPSGLRQLIKKTNNAKTQASSSSSSTDPSTEPSPRKRPRSDNS